MADRNDKTTSTKPRKAPRRKPFYVITDKKLADAGVNLLGTTNDAEEVMDIMQENPGASFIKVEPSAKSKDD